MRIIDSLPRNAVMAKARAMYGKRLTESDYEALLNFRTVAEAVSYLRTQTVYSSVLASENPSVIRIGRFKELLQKRLYGLSEYFCRYEKALNQPFYMYFVYKNDASILLQCINTLYDTAVFWRPVIDNDILTRYSELDKDALAKVSDYEQLLTAVKDTDYYKYLAAYRTEFYTSGNTYVALEDAVYTCLNKKILALCQKCFTGKGRDEVISALATINDTLTISSIVRLNSFPGLSGEVKHMRSFEELTAFSDKDLEKLRKADSTEKIEEILSHTKYRSLLCTTQGGIEDLTAKLMYDSFTGKLRFSRNQTVVLLSYLFLAQSEITDIMRITEGIRYSIPPEEIKRFLIRK